MATTPLVRTGLTHVGSAVSGAAIVIAWTSAHKVDLYAIWDQLNAVVASVTQLVTLISLAATSAFGMWNARTEQKLADIVADPQAPQIAAEMPVTPQTVAVAEALKKETT